MDSFGRAKRFVFGGDLSIFMFFATGDAGGSGIGRAIEVGTIGFAKWGVFRLAHDGRGTFTRRASVAEGGFLYFGGLIVIGLWCGTRTFNVTIRVYLRVYTHVRGSFKCDGFFN